MLKISYLLASLINDGSALPSYNFATTEYLRPSFSTTSGNKYWDFSPRYAIWSTRAVSKSGGSLNTWTCSGSVGRDNSNLGSATAGGVVLSGTLDRIRLYIDGTATFDNGVINIQYE